MTTIRVPNLSFVVLISLLSLLISISSGSVICEKLSKDLCSFAVSTSGKRCVLEISHGEDGTMEHQCSESEVNVERIEDWIESDECVKACGVDRNMVGISSDSLLEPTFAGKICSFQCYQDCPNIVDMYFNLAAGEGAFLPELCQAHRLNPRRSIMQLMSSSADGSSGDEEVYSTSSAPAPAPSA